MTENLLKKETEIFLKHLVKEGGPEKHEYDIFTSIVNNLPPQQIDTFRSLIKPMLNTSTLIGHAFAKPFGYPGDFSLIDHIYRYHINEDKNYRNWDQFFQNQHGAIAVRNRKKYFLETCRDLFKDKQNDIRILILGSGPATDVFELLSSNQGYRINVDLVDFDQNAIDFSIGQNEKFINLITFNRVNVLRFKPYKTYDLIWSAGLFDYFKDKHFIFLVRKYLSYLKDNSEFVISNFSIDNPTKKLMEILSDWYLNHRSKEDLFRIAAMAGIDQKLVKVDKEPLEVNLFLKLRSS